MRRRRVLLSVAAAGLTASTLAVPPAVAESETSAAPTTYTYVNLGWLATTPGGIRWSEAQDVNTARQVAGHGNNERDPASYAFRWQDGQLTRIPAIYAPGNNSAFGINEAGHVAGHTHTSFTEPAHAFVYRDGTVTDLGTGWGYGSGSAATDINNKGVVVGHRVKQQGAPHRAVLWNRNGKIRELGTLGGSTDRPFSTASLANAVNDRNQVVGTALPSTGEETHAFLWQNGVMTDLGTLGGAAVRSEAFDINEKTQIVGISMDAERRFRAFLWENGVMRQLGTLPGGNGSTARGINEAGQVVGYSRTTDTYYGQHAVLWDGDQMTDLNTVVTNLPGDVALETAEAINDQGVIVGKTCYYCEPGKTADEHAYMLIPNP
ncbi:hypothetical protein [Sphaerisporangium sp. TRM90804]|uniref:hypothetical protein n=1 Tax=Sphaerisporangium sp. TRM90804 TaxID=3031113 RepID=UPI002447DBD2|nr:hypothetical protein [Sphaerisporangium sp. TRM90804]MDH2427065.1 hypothetical protein [Sphaerisporangium sp. TRM90804]